MTPAPKASNSVRWNRAGDIGLAVGYSALLRIWDEGTLEVKVNTLRKVDHTWDDDDRIENLLRQLEQIDGVVLTSARRQWPLSYRRQEPSAHECWYGRAALVGLA